MNNTRCLKVYLTRVKDHDAHHHSRLPFKSSFTLHSPGYRSLRSHHRPPLYPCFYRGASFAPSMRGKKVKRGSSPFVFQRHHRSRRDASKLRRLEMETSTCFERDLNFDERIFWTINEKCLNGIGEQWLKLIFCCAFRSMM